MSGFSQNLLTIYPTKSVLRFLTTGTNQLKQPRRRPVEVGSSMPNFVCISSERILHALRKSCHATHNSDYLQQKSFLDTTPITPATSFIMEYLHIMGDVPAVLKNL